MSEVKTRFAPSPTGFLHVGNVRTAIHNALFAMREGGQFLLRLDDTDMVRSTQEYAEAIREDLAWLGLYYSEEVRQSDKITRYQEVADTLRAQGRLYACYETSQELDFKRKMQLARKQPPIYDRAALALSDKEKADYEAEGRSPHWRFKLNESQRVEFEDLVRGEAGFDMSALSDPVVIREDGSFLYMLPSVIDDIDMGITHVVRGEDHVTNSAVQVQMFEALGAKAPAFAHTALITAADGSGLSKRHGAKSIRDYRADGYEAMAINALLARLGTADPVEPIVELQVLADSLDFGRFGRAAAKFSEDELSTLNAKILHALPFDAVKDRVPRTLNAEAWHALQPNLDKLSDLAALAKLITGPIMPVIEDTPVVPAARACLPGGEWGRETWSEWVSAIKSETGAKGKNLFMPLRLALTGERHGPELAELLPLIGREKVEKRLAGEPA
ncbi:MAG: glutamate--tRNA ligase [Pseudomonadota bacterium]